MLSGQPWWLIVLAAYAALTTLFLVVAATFIAWAEIQRRRAWRARRQRARARGGFGIIAARAAEEEFRTVEWRRGGIPHVHVLRKRAS